MTGTVILLICKFICLVWLFVFCVFFCSRFSFLFVIAQIINLSFFFFLFFSPLSKRVHRLWEPPCSLPLEYWKRSEETQRAKDDHIDYLETLPYTREELIFRTTLADKDVAIEKNMFPYDTHNPCIEVSPVRTTFQ
jgi:hypothetical protein